MSADDEELTQVTGHPAGVSAVTQRGAVVALEFLWSTPPDDDAE